MKLFENPKSEELIKQLGKSQVDFEFDQVGGKKSLLAAIENISPETELKSSKRRPFILQFGLALGVVLLMMSGTFAAASKSLPGDKLFSVTKLKERVLLILPFSPQSRAEIQASIVEERLKALDQFPLLESEAPIKPDMLQIEARKLETLREASESLHQAVDSIQRKRDEFEKNGQTKQAEQLSKVLSNISEQSEKREKMIEEIEKKLEQEDESVKEKARERLEDLKKARNKARTFCTQKKICRN